jgi:hypothetical protein
MGNRFHGWCAAGMLVLFAPTLADAAWLGFRNDTRAVIVVQGASVVDNKLRWGKPYRLLPGEVYWEPIVVTGEKVVAVFDPRQPNRPVHQENIVTGDEDQFFSIQVEAPPAPAKGQPPAPPKIKLVPTDPPKKPKPVPKR